MKLFKKGFVIGAGVMLLMLQGSCFAACSTSKSKERQESLETPAEKLRTRMKATEESGRTMFGHHDDTAYGREWKHDPNRSDVLEATGEYPAMMSWDLGGLEIEDSLNLDGVPFDYIREQIKAQDARGGVNTLSWHLRNPINGKTSWDVDDKTIVAQMMKNPESYRKQLTLVANYIKSLKNEKGERIGVIFRPWHEHTGGWFFWGTPNTTPEEYKFLWTEMRKVFDKEGVDNVLWAYSPDRVANAEEYMARYPGDEYVDIMGLDVYHFNGEEGTPVYTETVSNDLGIVNELSRQHNKIPALTETGLEGIGIPGWYTDVLLPLLKQYKPAYVVVWRNANIEEKPEHYYTPTKGHPAYESFRKFVVDPQIIMIEKPE